VKRHIAAFVARWGQATVPKSAVARDEGPVSSSAEKARREKRTGRRARTRS
jgi:hypothetical protein